MVEQDRDILHGPKHWGERTSTETRRRRFRGLNVQHGTFRNHVHVRVEEPRE